MSLRVLVSGAQGQVGAALTKQLAGRCELLSCDVDRLDLTNPDSIKAVMDDFRPELVINPAAYTAVDRAEEERELAFAVNEHGVAVLADEAARLGACLIHFSTDYVFDGSGERPWCETDQTGPLSVYGASKLAGEQALFSADVPAIVLRTSWVFGQQGHNFVKTMLRLAGEREELAVIDDQHGAPTSAEFLAAMVTEMIPYERDAVRDLFATKAGLYHLTCAGETTWYGFAGEVFAAAERLGVKLKIKNLKPITTAEYPTAAVRPRNSRLDCRKFFAAFPELKQQTWQQALSQVMMRLVP